MDSVVEGRARLHGTLNVPGDKSISHRAVMLGCLASGESRIRGLSPGLDVGSTIEAFRCMGLSLDRTASEMRIAGTGIRGFMELKRPEDLEIDCGNSGTTARLLIGLLSGAGRRAVLRGDSSLSCRPMMRVVSPLNEHGADIKTSEGHLPVELGGGRLLPLNYHVPVPSAQVKSALMLAALFLDGRSRIIETAHTRDHTERMLLHMDGKITLRQLPSGREIAITGLRELTPLDLTVPGDLSSAVFFIAAALVTPGSLLTLRNVLLNPTRAHILEVFRRMGGRIETELKTEFPEPAGDVRVRFSKLSGIRVGAGEVPLIIDEIPALAACALFARGDTVVSGAGELRIKESDRIRGIARMIRAFGGHIEESEEGFTVGGRVPTSAAEVDPAGDHRIAMAASVIALATKGRSIIRDSRCVDISFPGFFGLLGECAGKQDEPSFRFTRDRGVEQ
jgi:3-phosphoshikimate 1-carboxyvinyltransferase